MIEVKKRGYSVLTGCLDKHSLDSVGSKRGERGEMMFKRGERGEMMIEPWITTFTGKQFYPAICSPDDISIKDIAHSLSNTCRFSGHCKTFYSVAEHCVRLSVLAPERLKIYALLHDAPEALTGFGDVSSMMKHETFYALNALEDLILHKIFVKLDIPFMTNEDIIELKKLEDYLLTAEVMDLMPEDCQEYWTLLEPRQTAHIEPWTHIFSETTYIKEYHRDMELIKR